MEQFLKLAQELKFDLTQAEIDDLLNKSQHVLNSIEMIKNFDLKPYTQYHLPSQHQLQLRDDEVIDNGNPGALFQNAVDFQEGFVVVKSEK